MDWPEDWEKQEKTQLGTSHLPEEVVKQKVVLGIWMDTHPDHPRVGLGSIGLVFGGRENPDLTAEELEFLEKCCDYAKRRLREKLI